MRLLRVVFSFLLLAPFADAAERQALHSHVPNAAKQLAPLKRMESTTHLELTIALPLRNAAGLNKLLEEIYDPSSPNYHHYLTPEEFAKQFAPSAEDYKALMAFANANNLTIIATHPNRTLLDVNGSVADVEKAFHLNMRVYKHPRDTRTFRAPDAEPSVDLAVPLLSISGLDDCNLPRPMNSSTTAFRKLLERTDARSLRGPLGDAHPTSRGKVGRAVPSAPRMSVFPKFACL